MPSKSKNFFCNIHGSLGFIYPNNYLLILENFNINLYKFKGLFN